MPQTVTSYSRLQIVLHWLIAALVLFQIVWGESMEEFADAVHEGGSVSGSDATLATGHYWAGLAILALVLVRIGLRLTRGAPPHAGDTPAFAAMVATTMHWAFYVLLVIVPISGLVAYYNIADVGDLHKLAKPAFILLVGVHGMAAIFNQFVRRDGTLARMLPMIGR